jgi:hypothetical protein
MNKYFYWILWDNPRDNLIKVFFLSPSSEVFDIMNGEDSDFGGESDDDE